MKRILVWLNVTVVALTIGYAAWQFNNATQALAQTMVQKVAVQARAQIATAAPDPVVLEGTPVRLVIPSLAIDLPVAPGKFDNGQHTWHVDDKIVDFIPATAPLSNTQGSMFLYGHNANNVLGKTNNMKVGDEAFVYTDNGHVFSYTFESAIVVKPSNTDVLNGLNLGKPGFKLMTCVGLWDQDRRIMTFTLKESA